MSNDDVPPGPRRMDRRSFLKQTAALAGLAAMTPLISCGSKEEDNTSAEKKTAVPDELAEITGSPTGNWNYPINQAEVNALYKKIYDDIKTAKNNNKTGKPLAIIVAEDHLGTHGLITQMIILSAAKKLGINTYATESAQKDLDKFTAEFTLGRPKQKDWINQMQAMINPQNDPAKKPASEAIVNAVFNLHAIENKRTDGQLYIPTYALANAFLRNFKLVAMDPKHDEVVSEIREPEMLRIMGDLKEDYIVATGNAHAVTIARGLKEKGQAVLVFDATHKKCDTSTLTGDTKRRFDEFYNDPSIIRIVMDGRPPESVNKLFAHAAEAELNFAYEKADPPFLTIAIQALNDNLGLSNRRAR